MANYAKTVLVGERQRLYEEAEILRHLIDLDRKGIQTLIEGHELRINQILLKIRARSVEAGRLDRQRRDVVDALERLCDA